MDEAAAEDENPCDEWMEQSALSMLKEAALIRDDAIHSAAQV